MNKVLNKLAITASTVCVAIAAAATEANALNITTDNRLDRWIDEQSGALQLEDFNDEMLNPGLSIESDAGEIAFGRFVDRLTISGNTTVFNFSTPINSFGGNWNLNPGGQGTGIAVTIDLFRGGTQTLNQQINFRTLLGNDGVGFAGLTSDVAFDRVILRAGDLIDSADSETYTLDNLRYAEIPTPVLLPGLIGMGVAALRKKQAEAIKEA